MLAHAILESYLWPISPRDLAVPTHIAPVRGPLRLHRQCVGIQPQSPVGWPWLWGPQAMKTAMWGTCLAQRSAEWQQLHTTPRPNRQPYGDPVPTYQQTSISLGPPGPWANSVRSLKHISVTSQLQHSLTANRTRSQSGPPAWPTSPVSLATKEGCPQSTWGHLGIQLWWAEGSMLLAPTEHLHKATSPRLGNVTNLLNT